jgi:hypothetical protein
MDGGGVTAVEKSKVERQGVSEERISNGKWQRANGKGKTI